MKTVFVFALLFYVAFAQQATASTTSLDLDKIRSQQQAIQADVLAGKGRYKEMPQSTKDELLAKQAEVLKTIGDKRDTGELTDSERLSMFNALEWIEATVNNTPDDRMVCRRETRTGSNRVATVCKTHRQSKESHERARRQMEGSMPLQI